MRKVSDAADDVGDNVGEAGDQASSASDTIRSGFSTAAKAIGVVTTAITGAVAGMVKLTKNATEYARQVDNAAQQSGIAVERIQELAFAAQQTSGADFDQVRDGLKELAIRSEEAAQGSGEAAEAFDRLGISQQFLRQSSTAEIFRRVREELQGASASLRTFTAETVLGGEAGEKMVEVLGLSNEEMQKLSEQARETGSVLSSDQVQALDETRKAWDRIWSTLKGVGRTIATAMLPVTKKLTPIVQQAASRLQELFQGLDPQDVASAMDTAIRWTRQLWSVTKTVANSIVDIWNSFVGGLSTLWEEWGTFVTSQATNTWRHVVSLFHGAAGVISGVWETLVGTLTGNWSRAWDGIKQVVTSAALTIAESIVSLVESILNTLSELTSRIPGVGGTISSGLDSAKESVASFRDRILEANKAASGLQDTWAGFAGGDFGGGGAGGLFDTSTDTGSAPPTGETPSARGDGPESSAVAGIGPTTLETPSITSQIPQMIKGLEKATQKIRTLKSELGDTSAVKRFSKAMGRLRESTDQQAQAAFKAGKQAAASADSFHEAATAAVNAARKQFEAALMRGVSEAVASALTNVPFPFNIAAATAAGAAAKGIFDQVVPKLDQGGFVEQGGFAKIHEGETILTKDLTSRLSSIMSGFPSMSMEAPLFSVPEVTVPTAAVGRPPALTRGPSSISVEAKGSLSVTMDELIFEMDRALRARGKSGLL